jgi:hypothetical protein
MHGGIFRFPALKSPKSIRLTLIGLSTLSTKWWGWAADMTRHARVENPILPLIVLREGERSTGRPP